MRRPTEIHALNRIEKKDRIKSGQALRSVKVINNPMIIIKSVSRVISHA
jgi:hypothetical protein